MQIMVSMRICGFVKFDFVTLGYFSLINDDNVLPRARKLLTAALMPAVQLLHSYLLDAVN